MAMTLKVSVGLINYTDWLRVTAARVGDEGNLVFEEWYDVPGLTFFYITVPTSGNYIIKFYDAPDDVTGGLLLEPSLILDARNFSSQYEVRWYQPNDLPEGVTLSPDGKELTDPYLANKIIDSYFKEGFRFLKDPEEVGFDVATGKITLVDLGLSGYERFRVVIQNATSVTGELGSEFAGVITITDENYTILAANKNKRFRCAGSSVKQYVTAPALSLLSDGDFIYVDNTVGGVALQARIFFPGSDRVLYNGWSLEVNELEEFWASRGEAVKLMKVTVDDLYYWEVIGDYPGIHVGDKLYTTSRTHTKGKPNDNSLFNLDALPRLMWWGKNVLTDKIVDDTITGEGWVRPADKMGVFAFTSDYTSLRMPNTQNLSVRHLKSFSNFGPDAANRSYDAPGGYQSEMVGPHTHPFNPGDQAFESDNANDRNVMIPGNQNLETGENEGTENRVANIGYIEFTFI